MDKIFHMIVYILIMLSAFFTIFYFTLAMGQLLHIIWNHYHESEDWGKRATHLTWTKNTYHQVKSDNLFEDIIIYGIILIVLMLVLPILNI